MPSGQEAGSVVETSGGRIQGHVVPAGAGRQAVAFRGVPFARAPVGDLRFRPAESPERAERWSGVLVADEPGPAPPQPGDDPMGSLLPGMKPQHTAESCLTLDLWAPAGDPDGKARPVMVWIPGGAFTIGAGSLGIYDAALFAAEQDVVMVSLNYRLGALGFLFLPDAGVVPNCGLSDIVAALRWLKHNAAAFGGDASNVTLFGESAGAGAILHLLVAPGAAGLFRRAILQSPGVSQVVRPELASKVAERFLARLGGSSRLWTASADDVVVAQVGAVAELAGSAGPMPFHPVVDGSFVAEEPVSGLAHGRAASIEIVLGTTADEMQLFAQGLSGLERDRLVELLFPLISGATGVGTERSAVEGLFARYETLLAEKGLAEVAGAIMTDGLMRLPAEQAVAALALHQPGTFAYSFAWRAGGAAAALGAFHGVDLPFTFGTFDRDGWAEFLGAGAGAQRISAIVRTAWATFARDGAPTVDCGWQPWDPVRRMTLVLDDPPTCVDDPLAERRAVWAALERAGSKATR
jgi:para-nitrobenzyl esterase